MNILHILNGDATARSFEETGLDGDVMVWREVLSEGPLEENISSGSFWRKRQEWIAGNFKETPENYQKNVLDQLVKLNEQYDELNLWFEFDLHCQANLLGVMAYLKQQTDLSSPSVYLICPKEYPGKENFSGMGELTGEELEYLYDHIRVQLSGIDFILAAEAWGIFVKYDAATLRAYINKNNFWGGLHCLRQALEARVKRLQLNENGLDYITQKLLDIYRAGATSRSDIYHEFWKTEKDFGMGDMELDIYLGILKNKGLIHLADVDS